MIWGVFNVCLVFVCARESFVVCGTMRLVFVVVWWGFLVCPVLHFHVRYKKILTDVWCWFSRLLRAAFTTRCTLRFSGFPLLFWHVNHARDSTLTCACFCCVFRGCFDTHLMPNFTPPWHHTHACESPLELSSSCHPRIFVSCHARV